MKRLYRTLLKLTIQLISVDDKHSHISSLKIIQNISFRRKRYGLLFALRSMLLTLVKRPKLLLRTQIVYPPGGIQMTYFAYCLFWREVIEAIQEATQTVTAEHYWLWKDLIENQEG